MKVKLGSSLKSNTAYVPGPGNYNSPMVTKKSAPNYGFGTSTRDGKGQGKKLEVPGPGSYKLRSSIGDVPEYAIPHRDPNNKYV